MKAENQQTLKFKNIGSLYHVESAEDLDETVEIVGVQSGGTEPHVVVRWSDGTLSVHDMEEVGEYGVPRPCEGWCVVKKLRNNLDRHPSHSLWQCRSITKIGFAECKDEWKGDWHWMAPPEPFITIGRDRRHEYNIDGQTQLVALQGFALTSGPDHYIDACGSRIEIRFEWRDDIPDPEKYFPAVPDPIGAPLVNIGRLDGLRPGKRILPYSLCQWYVSILEMGRTDWATFVDMIELYDLPIPARPEQVYGKKWTGWGNFLGLTSRWREPWISPQEAARNLGVRDISLYIKYKEGLQSARLAMAPHLKYRNRFGASTP